MFAGKKRQQISDKLCMILWGDHLVEWKAYPSRNTGRGLIILWRKDHFVLSDIFSEEGYLGIRGCFKGEPIPVTVFNIYSQCALLEKRRLWERLVRIKASKQDTTWISSNCFLFNVVSCLVLVNKKTMQI